MSREVHRAADGPLPPEHVIGELRAERFDLGRNYSSSRVRAAVFVGLLGIPDYADGR